MEKASVTDQRRDWKYVLEGKKGHNMRARPFPSGRRWREERVNEFRDGGKTRQPLRENQRVTTSFSSVPKFVHTFFAAPSPGGRGNPRSGNFDIIGRP